MRTELLPTLDGWRGIAILLVVLAHAVKPPYCTGEASAEWCRYALLGGHGVALFFALSGFLITTRLLNEYDARGGISLRAFYIRRAFRILPAAVAVLFTFSVLGALRILPVAPIEIASSLLFFRNYVPIFLSDAGHGFYTALFWSLAVEEHFYLVWPFLLALSIKGGWSAKLAIGAAIAIALWRRLDGHYLWVHNALDLPQYQFNFRTDTRLDALLWGCTFALLLRDARVAGMLKHLLRPRLWIVLPGLYAAGIVLEWKGVLWHTLLAPPMIVGTMLYAQSLPARVLEWSPLRWLGRVSYSLYLWHPLVMPQIAAAVVWPRVQSLPLNLLLAFLLASASYYLVEKPMMGWGRRLAARLSAVEPVRRYEHAR